MILTGLPNSSTIACSFWCTMKKREVGGRGNSAEYHHDGGRERSQHQLAPSLRLLQLVERQEGHDALPGLAVDDDLVGAAQHALHGLEIHALARHVGRLLVFLVDLEEARRLAGGLGDGLLLVALGGLQDALGLAARLRNDLAWRRQMPRSAGAPCRRARPARRGRRRSPARADRPSAAAPGRRECRTDSDRARPASASARSARSSGAPRSGSARCCSGRRSRAWRSRPPLSRWCRGSGC